MVRFGSQRIRTMLRCIFTRPARWWWLCAVPGCLLRLRLCKAFFHKSSRGHPDQMPDTFLHRSPPLPRDWLDFNLLLCQLNNTLLAFSPIFILVTIEAGGHEGQMTFLFFTTSNCRNLRQ